MSCKSAGAGVATVPTSTCVNCKWIVAMAGPSWPTTPLQLHRHHTLPRQPHEIEIPRHLACGRRASRPMERGGQHRGRWVAELYGKLFAATSETTLCLSYPTRASLYFESLPAQPTSLSPTPRCLHVPFTSCRFSFRASSQLHSREEPRSRFWHLLACRSRSFLPHDGRHSFRYGLFLGLGNPAAVGACVFGEQSFWPPDRLCGPDL